MSAAPVGSRFCVTRPSMTTTTSCLSRYCYGTSLQGTSGGELGDAGRGPPPTGSVNADKNWLNTPDKIWSRFPGANIEKRQPFFPAVPCRQFVRFCCDKGPFCADLKTALCSRYGANDYLSFIMIFSGATFSVI